MGGASAKLHVRTTLRRTNSSEQVGPPSAQNKKLAEPTWLRLSTLRDPYTRSGIGKWQTTGAQDLAARHFTRRSAPSDPRTLQSCRRSNASYDIHTTNSRGNRRIKSATDLTARQFARTVASLECISRLFYKVRAR